MGAGIQGTKVADMEAKIKEDEAFAQAASVRSDAAAKMADDLFQAILKFIDSMLQLNNIVNQGVSNVSQKV